MLASIMHRATGVALGGGRASCWPGGWSRISNGPEGYDSFMVYAATPLGLLVLFGFTWALAFHFLNGIRHLAWDLGYGFDKHTADPDRLSGLCPVLPARASASSPSSGPAMGDICNEIARKRRCTRFRAWARPIPAPAISGASASPPWR